MYIYIYMYYNMIYNICFILLLNMDLRRNRPSYEYKSSFWPPAGMIMVMIIVVHARNYNYNYYRAHQKL